MFPLGFLFVAFFKLFDCEFNTFYVSTIINNTYSTNSIEPPTIFSNKSFKSSFISLYLNMWWNHKDFTKIKFIGAIIFLIVFALIQILRDYL